MCSSPYKLGGGLTLPPQRVGSTGLMLFTDLLAPAYHPATEDSGLLGQCTLPHSSPCSWVLLAVREILRPVDSPLSFLKRSRWTSGLTQTVFYPDPASLCHTSLQPKSKDLEGKECLFLILNQKSRWFFIRTTQREQMQTSCTMPWPLVLLSTGFAYFESNIKCECRKRFWLSGLKS